jgi:hypothetical protein
MHSRLRWHSLPHRCLPIPAKTNPGMVREQRKREEGWLREERKRAREWMRDHGYDHYPVPAYIPYVVEPVYPPEGITITRDGVEVWFTL